MLRGITAQVCGALHCAMLEQRVGAVLPVQRLDAVLRVQELGTVLLELGLGAVLLELGGIQHQSLGIACCEDSAHWLEEEFRLLCYIPQYYCLRRLYIRICSVLRSDLVAISVYTCMYFTTFPDVQRLRICCRS